MLVVIFPSLPSPSLEDFTVRTAQAWRIGRKAKDDGAVLFAFVEERKLRLEVGYGLEGAIPDAVAKRILDEHIAPSLKAGQPESAFAAGIEAILAAADGRPLPGGGPPPSWAPETSAAPSPSEAPREPTALDVAIEAVTSIASFTVGGVPVGLAFLAIAFPTLTSPVLRFLPIRRRVKRGEPLPRAWLVESAILLWIILSSIRSGGGGSSYGGSSSSSTSGGGGRFGGGGASGSW